MKNITHLIVICFLSVIIFSCHRKTVPHNSATVSKVTVSTKKTDETKVVDPAEKKAAASKVKTPSVIIVNDSAAQKTVDGRYYYDLNGKRYWRNNKDGKYYLFNKSMYNNPDFKPAGKS